jgi:hypothetical protein
MKSEQGYEIILRCCICEEEFPATNLWTDLSDLAIYDIIAQSAEMQEPIIVSGYCARCCSKYP